MPLSFVAFLLLSQAALTVLAVMLGWRLGSGRPLPRWRTSPIQDLQPQAPSPLVTSRAAQAQALKDSTGWINEKSGPSEGKASVTLGPVDFAQERLKALEARLGS